jgi:ATP adenylyltransferase
MPLDRLYAGWRRDYVEQSTAHDAAGATSRCVFCDLGDGPVSEDTGVVFLGERTFVVLNAYPYGSGHVLVCPRRHVASIQELDAEESAELWSATTDSLRALDAAYSADGANLGANLGRAAGAGIPGHLHLHVLPRWNGDTNFMTSVGETRVLPEALEESWTKIAAAFTTLR